jgi:hypothetical protein
MRNHQEILGDIDKTFADNDLAAERIVLQDEIDQSRTNAEICINCGQALLLLDKENAKVNSCAGELIKEFIRYCSANGLRVRI